MQNNNFHTCEEKYDIKKDKVIDKSIWVHYVSLKTFEQDAWCEERCRYVCKILQSFPDIEKNIKQREEWLREWMIRDKKLEENTNFRIKRKRH